MDFRAGDNGAAFLGWDLGGFNFQLLADRTSKAGVPKTWLAARRETGAG